MLFCLILSIRLHFFFHSFSQLFDHDPGILPQIKRSMVDQIGYVGESESLAKTYARDESRGRVSVTGSATDASITTNQIPYFSDASLIFKLPYAMCTARESFPNLLHKLRYITNGFLQVIWNISSKVESSPRHACPSAANLTQSAQVRVGNEGKHKYVYIVHTILIWKDLDTP